MKIKGNFVLVLHWAPWHVAAAVHLHAPFNSASYKMSDGCQSRYGNSEFSASAKKLNPDASAVQYINQSVCIWVKFTSLHYNHFTSHYNRFTSHYNHFTSHYNHFTSHYNHFTSHYNHFTSHYNRFTSHYNHFTSHYNHFTSHYNHFTSHYNHFTSLQSLHFSTVHFTSVDPLLPTGVEGTLTRLYVIINITSLRFDRKWT